MIQLSEDSTRLSSLALFEMMIDVVQVVCGNRAGAATILLDEEGRSLEEIGLLGEQVPTFVARSLHDVAVLLKEKFELRPKNDV